MGCRFTRRVFDFGHVDGSLLYLAMSLPLSPAVFPIGQRLVRFR